MAVVAALLGACGAPATTGPPELRLGVDSCDGCGMAIAEPRYAAAAIVADGTELRVLRFDDIGCLARWEIRANGAEVRERWVHDRDTGAWIDAATATYARPRGLVTPMGSSLVAFEPHPGASARRTEDGGDALSWSAVLARARDGSLARQPEPGAGEPR